MLNGKGYYIWQVSACEGGNIPAIVQAAVDAGLQHVLVKAADGDGKFNMRRTPTGWKDDILPALVPALQAAGIEVWGWQYVYLYNPAGEAKVARERIAQLGLQGWVIDAEAEAKHKPAQTKAYMAGLITNVPLALSTYRYPSLHQELAWATWLAGVDLVMPQVYWMQATNAGQQLALSYGQYQQMAAARNLPYLPTGAAFYEKGWGATPAQVLEFMTQAQAMGLPGVNFWSWQHARAIPGMWEAIAGFDWDKDPAPGPAPVPVDRWIVDHLYPWAKQEGFEGPAPIITE